MLKKIINSKWRIINITLCVIGILNIILTYKFNYNNLGNAIGITYLLIAITSISNAVYYKKQGMKKEFITNGICCILFIALAIFMFLQISYGV